MFILISNLLFRLKRGMMRRLIRMSPNRRPASLPYISGDGFRSISDHIFSKDFNPKNVKDRDVVFVELSDIKDFFNNFHNQITNKYILISHNGDETIDETIVKYVDDKIIIWFSQNVNVVHPKIRPIPIGLENYYFYNFGITSMFDNLRKIKAEKKNRILFGFNISTNPTERKSACDHLCLSSIADRIKSKINAWLYLKLLKNYKFVASPPGNGIDCHRTWEAMYLGVVPVVKKSVLVDYFFTLGLPLVVVGDWQEIDLMDEKWLSKKYDDLKTRFDHSVLFMNYWSDLVLKFKAQNNVV